MNLRKSSTVLSLLFALAVNAQTDYRPGYIIKNGGDTLFGSIAYQKDIILGAFCRFKYPNDSIINYNPETIEGYRFTDSRFFVSREINQRKVFLEYLLNGKVDFYYLRDDAGDHYFVEKDTFPLTELAYKEITKYIDGKEYIFEFKNYINQLAFFMQDAPDISQRINLLAKPEHRELIKLGEYYHHVVCTDKSCIIYERPTPFLVVSLEPFIGAIKISKIDPVSFEYGAYINFWAPRTNEKLYFRTGIIHYGFNDVQKKYYEPGGNVSINSIPFNVFFVSGKDPLKTKIGFGYNLLMLTGGDVDKMAIPAPCLVLGLMNKITKSTAMTFSFTAQTTPFVAQFKHRFSVLTFSLDAGLNFNL